MNISIIKLLTLLLLPVVYKIIYLIAADNWGDEIEYIQVLFHQISVLLLSAGICICGRCVHNDQSAHS